MPDAVFLAVAFLFGLLIGSFLNVCIYRLPRDISVVRPRSHCPSCRSMIAWYDNIPVLSMLLLGGRCRHCLTAIPWRYAAVELATGCAFLASAAALGPTAAAAKYGLFAAIAIGLIVTDLQDRLLPDELTLGGALIGVAFAPFVSSEPGLAELLLPNRLGPGLTRLADAASAALLCGGLMWLLPWLYQKIRHREGGWMGFGDVKMMAMIGAFLGLRGSFLTIFLGGLLGSVVGYAYILWRKKDPSSYELPFGSFLGVAALIVAVWTERLAGAVR